MSHYVVEPNLSGEDLKICIVRARFNEEIGILEMEACLAKLQELGVDLEESVLEITVPGALELGVTIASLAQGSQFDAIIALGAVIRGETYHFEVVSNESATSLMRISENWNIPVANGVLTCETEAQALERAKQKGEDCALAAVEMANLLIAIDDFNDDSDDFEEDEEEYEER